MSRGRKKAPTIPPEELPPPEVLLEQLEKDTLESVRLMQELKAMLSKSFVEPGTIQAPPKKLPPETFAKLAFLALLAAERADKKEKGYTKLARALRHVCLHSGFETSEEQNQKRRARLEALVGPLDGDVPLPDVKFTEEDFQAMLEDE